MKITSTNSKTITSGGVQKTGFTMQSSGKMFRMVISGLYSDKAQSITREIYSNAFDAHAMAGVPEKPFDVSLPSRFTPEFAVRDYGEGLSDEWMNEKYTEVGFSAKEDTNLAVGKWGVGRMSPLSYIDTFTVTSIHKGLKAVYNVTMEEDGEPQLNTLVPPMETDEPSGLKVSFPVKPADQRAFVDAAKRVSLGLPVKPTVGTKEYDGWPSFVTGTGGDGYATYESSYMSGVYVQMGCVMYPVDLSLLELTSTEQMTLRQTNLLLQTPIGAVEVTASREDLSYGSREPTKPYLSKVLSEIVKSLVKDTQDKVDVQVSSYLANKVLKESGLPLHLRNMVTYKGSPLKNWSFDNYFDTLKRNWKGKVNKSSEIRGTEVFHAIVVGYKDGPKRDVRMETRVRAWAEQELQGMAGKRIVYVWWEYDKDKKVYHSDVATEVLTKMAGTRIVNVSDIPDTGVVARVKSNPKVYNWNNGQVTVDMEQGGFYVTSTRGDVEGHHYKWTGLWASLKRFEGKQLATVNQNLRKKFDDHPKWTKVNQELLDLVDKEGDTWAMYYLERGVSDRLGAEIYRGIVPELDLYYKNLESVVISPEQVVLASIARAYYKVKSGAVSPRGKAELRLREVIQDKYPYLNRSLKGQEDYLTAMVDFYKKKEKQKGDSKE